MVTRIVHDEAAEVTEFIEEICLMFPQWLGSRHSMRLLPCILGFIIAAVGLAIAAEKPGADDPPARTATIHIDASKTNGRISRYLNGACIEDVNHEIYGGLYSQMIFGESFQEPAPSLQIEGFTAYGGSWQVEGQELRVDGGPGPKLLSDHPAIATGEVGVEVFFPDNQRGNAGLIVKVDRPGMGADNFIGYEVALDPEAGKLVLGRHERNWQPIQTTPCVVPVGRWIRLVVRLTEKSLEVLIDGRPLLRYEDDRLRAGAVGLRPWQRSARYRNLWVKVGDQTHPLPFKTRREGGGAVSGMWQRFRRGAAIAQYDLETTRPFVGGQSQRLTFVEGDGEAGVANQGLNRWGISLMAGKPYEGATWVRCERPVELNVLLQSRDGERTYAREKLPVAAGDWQRLTFALTPDTTDPAGRFAISLSSPGSAVLGYAFLQPGPWGRFRGLPLRRDVVEGMRDMGVTVLRYGGSMVNNDEYRWKKMIGPRDRRPPYHGTWYAQSTNGWGIVDFLDLCEAAGFEAIPAFNIHETPQDMVDFIAYVNGPPNSPWGKRRATDGHPAPYRLKYLELGNEEKINDDYVRLFRAVADAVWAADPEVILIVGDFSYGMAITDPDHVQGAASGITSLTGHRAILEHARSRGREVWFDIHVGTEAPTRLVEVAAVPSYVEALARLSGGAKHRVVIFELNAGNHAQRRALANAMAIGQLQQLGERLPFICSANGLQPDGQNDNGWDQGLLFLDPVRTWLQPPGHVMRMISRSYQPVNLPIEIENGAGIQAAAARSEDGKTLVLRVVNPGDRPHNARIDIVGFRPNRESIAMEELAGLLDTVNTASRPRNLVPRTSVLNHAEGSATIPVSLPAHSFTIFTIE